MYGRLLLRTEGPRSALVLLAGVLFGGLFGHAWLGMTLALLGLLVFHLRQAAILHAWSQAPKQRDLPGGSGIWQELFNDAYNRHKRARKRKKRLSAILREFRASTSALPDAAVVLDAEGQIAWYNDAARDLFGLQGGRDIGQRINNLVRHPAFTRYYHSEDTERQGVEIPSSANPAISLWVRLIPYGRQQKLLIARDISDFKRLEQMRRDFVANASHELRTPLTVVRGYLDMLVEESTDDGPLKLWRDPLAEMRRQATRMQQIIADMLKLANLEVAGSQAKREVVDMPAMLGGALEEAESISAGRHAISHEVAPDLKLLGSHAELYSAVSNLLSNALRYTPDGGSVSLKWEERGGKAVLSVEDSGIGIDAADLPRLTERFYRADVARSRETGGTGLGLAIVKHALERHEARLVVRSTPGQGSRFSCEFPARRIARGDALAEAS